MKPQRIQLRRVAGWRKPEGVVVVARPSRWGNPYTIERNEIALPTPDGRWKRAEGDRLVVVRKRRYSVIGRWGSWPNTAIGKEAATQFAVDMFAKSIEASRLTIDGPIDLEFWLRPLVGRDLACWCPIGQPCHADVLLEWAAKLEGTP